MQNATLCLLNIQFSLLLVAVFLGLFSIFFMLLFYNWRKFLYQLIVLIYSCMMIFYAAYSWPSLPPKNFQEPVKSKHPQLHYESKLYMLLQGGSKSGYLFHFIFLVPRILKSKSVRYASFFFFSMESFLQ